MRRRLDAELLRRGLAASRAEASTAIREGRVTVSGSPAVKAATLVAPDEPVALTGPARRFASRAGEKLEAALERFEVDVTGRHALDAGASTGGFTDCLLQRGAAEVVAVDVGYGQLAWRLRDDARVTVLERTNVKDLRPADLPFAPDAVTADLSFISLASVVPALVALAAPGAELVVLVKPQFEAGRAAVGKGGVVSDPAAWGDSIRAVTGALADAGAGVLGAMASPLLGPAGNAEFLVHARLGAEDALVDADIDAAVAEAAALRPASGEAGVSRVGFVTHPVRKGAIEVARSLVDWLRENGHTSVSLPDETIGADEKIEPEAFAEGLDLVVSVGGDGTLLRGAELARRGDVPLLGVNEGRLGFLTAVDPPEARGLLEAALAGTAPIEERMAIEAHPENVPWEGAQWALNEVMTEKRARHRLISLSLSVDGEYVTSLSADGVIVATPTGSTAYSFSARGPIVSPRMDGLLLTPVSPHMVFDRPIVLDPREEVVVEVVGAEPGIVSADGRPGLEMPVGGRLRIRRSDRPARLVRKPGAPSFYRLLRDKFDLPSDVFRAGPSPEG